jgi:hypothetical protein
VLQHRALELLQCPARLEAELVGKKLPCPPVDLERVGLPPRSVERQHELAAQPLLERVRPHERLELRDEPAPAAEREVGVDAIHERRQAKLLEASDLRLDEIERREIGERRPAEERQRCPERSDRGGRISAVERRASVRHESLELGDIELVGIGANEITAGAGFHGLVLEETAEPRDRDADGPDGGVRSLGTEELLGEVFRRDELVRVQQEQREQAALPLASERERLAVTQYLERPQETKPQPGCGSCRHRRSIRPARPGFQSRNRARYAPVARSLGGWRKLARVRGVQIARRRRAVSKRIILASAVTAALVAMAAGALVSPARATYPGDVGRLAFGMRDSSNNPQIYTARPNGAGLHQLTTGDGFNACAAYSPDGKQIAFCSGRSGAFEIWAMNQNGHDLHQVTNLGGYATFPDYSPDGSKIAFSGTEGDAQTDQIYVVDSSGNGLKALTDDASFNDYPAYSPDGSKIAFISDRTGVEQVWEMNSDGSDPVQLTHSGVTNDQLPDWSPDGTKIAYEEGDSPNGHIFVMNADGSDPTQLTESNGDDFGAAWSPDGTQIAFVRNYGNGDRPVMVMNADGSDQHQLLPGSWTGFVPAWQPLGAGG